MKGYRKILIAVNGSRGVLTQGLKLADDEKCWVTVIRVIPQFEGDLNLTGIKNIGDVLCSDSGKAISEINHIADGGRALIKTRLEEGKTHEKILSVAEEEKCDVIIMGSQGKRSWIRKLLGDNVLGKVINQAPCPVLVVSA